MTGRDHSRSRADALLLSELAAGSTIADAAQRAGVSPATVRRRLADPTFRAQLARAQSELVERATAALTSASTEAVETLRELLRDGPPSTRLQAARAILDAAPKWRDTADIEQRLAAIEASLREADR